jgi:hypothetical protein
MEWLLESATLGILLFWFFYLPIQWDSLPDRVPSGFGFSGRPRGAVSRSMLWLLPCVGFVLYGLQTRLSRFPHLHNFPVEVTLRNAETLYSLARRLLQLLKFELVASFGYIEWKMIQTARGNAAGLGPWFVPLLLAVVTTTSLYYSFRMRRCRED